MSDGSSSVVDTIEASLTNTIGIDVDGDDLASALPWKGVLKEQDIQRLHELFDSTLITPGRKMRLHRIDPDGKMLIPGCASGFPDSKRTLTRWKQVADDEASNRWWVEHLAKKRVPALYVKDVLDGLDASKWERYRILYDRVTTLQRVVRHNKRKQKAAIERAATERKEKRRVALSGLLDLTQNPGTTN